MTDNIQTNSYYGRRKSPVTPILVTALVTALVVGGGIFLYQSSKMQQERDHLQAQIRDLEIKKDECSIKPSSSTDSDSTKSDSMNSQNSQNESTIDASAENLPPVPASWKTYNNAKLGFSFRYPSTYTLSQDKPDTTGLKLSDQSSAAKATLTLLVDSDTEFSDTADITYDLTSASGSLKLTNKKLGKGDTSDTTLTTILASSQNTGTKIGGHTFDLKYTFIKNSDVDIMFKQIISSFKIK